MEITEELKSKMIYCKQFRAKILPSTCVYRKNIGEKHKNCMSRNEKYGIHSMIYGIVEKCIPCKQDKQNDNSR